MAMSRFIRKEQGFVDCDDAVKQHSIRFARILYEHGNVGRRQYTYGGPVNTYLYDVAKIPIRRMNNLYKNKYFGYCNGKRCIHARELTMAELQNLNCQHFAYMQEVCQTIPVIKTEHFKGLFFEDLKWHPAWELPTIMNVLCEFLDVFLVCDYVQYKDVERQREDILADASSRLYVSHSEVVDDTVLDYPGECIDSVDLEYLHEDLAEDIGRFDKNV